MLKASWSDACESLKDAFLQPTESSYWGWTEQNTNQREGLHSPRNKSKVFCVPGRRISTATVYLHRCSNTIPGAKWGAIGSSESSLWTLESGNTGAKCPIKATRSRRSFLKTSRWFHTYRKKRLRLRRPLLTHAGLLKSSTSPETQERKGKWPHLPSAARLQI